MSITQKLRNVLSAFRGAPRTMSRAEFVEQLQRFVDGTDRGLEWDSFESVSIADPELEEIRIDCVNHAGMWPEHLEETREYFKECIAKLGSRDELKQ
jgi:hypothetical protein